MPSLLAFFPCERVIIEQETQNVSISTIIQELQLVVAAELLPPPKGTVVPMQWAVFSMWERRDDEPREAFESKLKIVTPSGEDVEIAPASKFDFENFTKRSQRVHAVVKGFPVWEAGTWELVLSTRTFGRGEFIEAARFPIVILHKPEATPA
jgi:hypothetical protein